MKKIKLTEWDPTKYLETEEDMRLYFQAAIEDDPGDGSLIRSALGDIAKARGMSQLARETGLSRENLYRSLSSSGNPEFSTVMKVIHALGYRLHAELAAT